jgi:hypothetical protein
MSGRVHNIVSLVVAVAFVVGLGWFVQPVPVFRFLLPAGLILLVLLASYNVWFLKRHNNWNVWLWLRPLLVLSSWFGLFFFIPSGFLRGIFLLLSVLVVVGLQRMLGSHGQRVVVMDLLVGSLTSALVTAGLAQYFTVPIVVYLTFYFLFTFIFIRSIFEYLLISTRAKWLLSAIIAFAASELLWALLLLPLHYSVLGMLLGLWVYTASVIVYGQSFGQMTFKRIVYHLTWYSIIILILITATSWEIISR